MRTQLSRSLQLVITDTHRFFESYSNGIKKSYKTMKKLVEFKKRGKMPVTVKRTTQKLLPVTGNVRDDSESYGQQVESIINKGYGKTLEMTPSAMRFAKVYADPFIQESARIPAFPMNSSQLCRSYASGKGVLNANGNGYITCNIGNGIFSDQPVACYTSGAGASDVIVFGNYTGVSTVSTNSEFTSTNFYTNAGSFNKAFRVVAFGVRVRYLGTEYYAAGTCYALQMSPKTSANSLNGFNIADFKGYPGFKEYSFADREWHSVTRHITSSEDFQYQGWNTSANACQYLSNDYNNQLSFDALNNIGFFLNGTAGQPFEFEVVGHYEVVGPNITRNAVVPVDMKGVNQVTSSYTKMRHLDSVTPDHSVERKPDQKGGWIDILKRGAELALPMIPKLVSMFL